MAWNVVTSWSKSAALALGKDDVVPHDERYEVASEYMDLVYRFWESSWGEGAKVWDQENRIAYDAAKVKKIEYNGLSSVSCLSVDLLMRHREVFEGFFTTSDAS